MRFHRKIRISGFYWKTEIWQHWPSHPSGNSWLLWEVATLFIGSGSTALLLLTAATFSTTPYCPHLFLFITHPVHIPQYMEYAPLDLILEPQRSYIRSTWNLQRPRKGDAQVGDITAIVGIPRRCWWALLRCPDLSRRSGRHAAAIAGMFL